MYTAVVRPCGGALKIIVFVKNDKRLIQNCSMAWLYTFLRLNESEGHVELHPLPPEARGSSGGFPKVWWFSAFYYKNNVLLGIFKLKFSPKPFETCSLIITCLKLK